LAADRRTPSFVTDAVIVCCIGIALYVSSGTLGAYFARDDFAWLLGARTLPLSYSFQLEGRTHFYRPAAELWWAGAYRVCDTSASCYHALELAAHILNALLFMHLTRRVLGRRDIALAAAVTFVVIPAYVQAVIWVCAVTTILAALFYLLCLHATLSVAGRERSGWYSIAALISGAAALYTHESCATLALTIPLVIWLSPETRRYRPDVREVTGIALVLLVFTYTTVAANRANYVFTEGHYAAGRHALQHGLDYVRSLYIGRRAAVDYAALALAGVAIVAAGNRATRLGLAWMLLTMVPFLSFTWGNVGRYTYLPAMGFSLIVAGVVVAIRDAMQRRVSSRMATAVAYTLLLLIDLRFAAFARGAIRGEVGWMEEYRTYATTVMNTPALHSNEPEVAVAPPASPAVERDYVAPMLRWETGNSALVVRFTDR
jgi:hypothetical protein